MPMRLRGVCECQSRPTTAAATLDAKVRVTVTLRLGPLSKALCLTFIPPSNTITTTTHRQTHTPRGRKGVDTCVTLYTHIHSYSHTHTHELTHTHIHSYSHTHSYTHSLTHSHTHSHAYTHIRTHSLTHSLTHTHTLTHSESSEAYTDDSPV